MIQFEHVFKKYGKTTILNDINMTIEDGQFVVLIGTSGCGKTTTLKTINRLITPEKGKILINGEDIRKKDPVKLRRHIGYVIQQIGLFPHMTVSQNIAVVLKLLKKSKEEISARVNELLAMIGMEAYADKYPSEMSGGQQQRIGVLRALAAAPPIVLMDEPFGALDPVTRAALQDDIKKIQKKLKTTIIFVTHDMDEALKLADVIVFMDKGQIVQMASPEEMLEAPANDLVRGFLGKHLAENAVPSKVEDFMRTSIYTVKKNEGIRRCVETMARNNVDSLLVVDDDEKYIGTVSIADIRSWGRELKDISPIVRSTEKTVRLGDEAKESFDYLLETKANYVVVLDEDNSIAGIITQTSVARSVAESLWG